MARSHADGQSQGRGTRPARPDRLDPDVDDRIIEASAQLIAELGYDGMSIEAVAARAGVGKASIYRRWSSKADLVLATMRAEGFPVPGTRDTGSLRGDLLALLLDLQGILDAQGMAHVVGVLIAMRRDPELTSIVHEQLVTRWARHTEGIVSRAVDRGEIQAPSAGTLELVSQIAPSIVSLRVLASLGPVDAELMHRIVDDVLVPLLDPPGR